MEFRPFDKMKTASNLWTPKEVGGLWCVTEKIHGANMQCIVGPEDSVRWGKRTSELEPTDNFFGFRTAVAVQHEEKAITLLRLTREYHSARGLGEVSGLAVCGELCGGEYPHPEVDAAPGVMPIQTGVWYSPNLHFVAFDLEVELADGKRDFMEYAAARQLLEEAEFMVLPPLLIGNFEEVCNSDHNFTTTFPALIGLPPLANDNNKAEGIVIKPLVCKRDAGEERIFMKRKIEEFSEKKCDAVTTWQRRQDDTSRSQEAEQEERQVEALLYETLACVTPQRLDAVISKYGRLQW
ncbi:hypothetical protein CYMTET_34357 [Cymbomonas tetramitiformis]|uniref:RNA ligase domain-containing protein n=1 Tax=Cymbomonas tetramitiformis TaxID=36881 RepID=A0AAE0FBA5_9CHLO|nr:hypothetical protein CYMTET_34357 [Cymbomonas tetramitiformis]|eukprot:gene25120-30657_t